MKPETAILWWQLNVLSNKRRYDLLVERYGNLDAAIERLDAEMLRDLGCREQTIAEVFGRQRQFDASEYGRKMEEKGVRLLSIEDDLYPEALRMIEDAPVFLSYHGDISILSQPLVALVGTRAMTHYGKRVAGFLIPDLVRSGVVTVSGLALGIDAEVARCTLDAGGKTVAVLGGGLGAIYPQSNNILAKEIVEKGGLLLSEFPLDLPPEKYTFPSRNRIIAGLSLGTVVLEAPEKSGAIITAELALDYNRQVFAVPGPVFEPCCAGCHKLIMNGEAKLVSSAQDILIDIGIIPSTRAEPVSFHPASEDEKTVWTALTTMPQAMDDLVQKSGLNAGIIGSTLTILELQGVVKNVGGGLWVRV